MKRGGSERIAVIGAGRLANALAPQLHRRAGAIVAIASRRRSSAVRLARRLTDQPRSSPISAGTSIVRAANAADWILLAVPDRAIEPLAQTLAGSKIDWKDRVVLHHAGALGPECLIRLADRGAETGVLHPLQCMGRGPAGGDWIAGSFARIEGSPRALRVAGVLARAARLQIFRVDADWTVEKRRAYHAGASLVANDLLALLHSAMELLGNAGCRTTEAQAGLLRLIEGTLGQVGTEGVAPALTGPAVRGDLETVAGHLKALESVDARVARAHRELSSFLADLGATAGRGGKPPV